MIETNRRSLITGLIAFAATAPAIVRAASIMPVRAVLWPAERVYICTVSGITMHLEEISASNLAAAFTEITHLGPTSADWSAVSGIPTHEPGGAYQLGDIVRG